MNCFFIVGPTATGKSELAAEVACRCNAEIVSADAFQVYRGLDLLTAKPDAATLAKAPHYLIGALSLKEELNAEKFRQLALSAIREIQARGKPAIVVGGSGLYIKALTHGLARLPAANAQLRGELNQLSVDELRTRLMKLDPQATRKIDIKNPRRLVRALEICLMTGRPLSEQRTHWSAAETAAATTHGVFVLRDRDELHTRINQRVELMFENGVIEEVVAAGPSRTGVVSRGRNAISATASKMIGLREIQQLLEGKMSILQCIAAIQQATRRYAKRQLTWFRCQTNFEPLNLSSHGWAEAISGISQRVRTLSAKE